MASSIRVATSLLALFLVGASFVGAQNRGDCRGQQPTSWSMRIVDDNEAGEPMVISGQVFNSDGSASLAGHTVFVFQTDAEGYYSVGGMDESDARLCGLVLTDSEGRYRFETIRPAHYATGGPPAHVHIRVWGPGTPRQNLTLNFEGDPKLGERGRDASDNPTWATIRPARADAQGVLQVRRDLRVRRQQ
jgi:protocatechuate 3,4-dioxygenase beta subunit